VISDVCLKYTFRRMPKQWRLGTVNDER